MLARRSLGLRPRLNRLEQSTPLSSIALLDPQIGSRPAAAVGRQGLASASPTASTSSHLSQQGWLEQVRFRNGQATRNGSQTPLDLLLQAIQQRDTSQFLPRFLAWTETLAVTEDNVQDVQTAHEELQKLPVATFSEILRSIDPIANPEQDIAHGLVLNRGRMMLTNAAIIVDEYGVRKKNRALLDAVTMLYEARVGCEIPLLLHDYEVLLRCAGAASDVQAAIRFFGAISKHGLARERNTSTWIEFIKARFLTEPMYYQWNRANVAVLARQTYSNLQPYEPKALWRMERMRLSQNALIGLPLNRVPGKERQDLRMWLRRKRKFRSYYDHWVRSTLYGVLVNEELLCTSMIAFARSSSLANIKGIILRQHFAILINEDHATGEVTIRGGKDFRPGNPREPTVRLLHAIVEAFGTMSRIPTGLKLLVFVSNRYNIPIPHETWSNMLNWAYVCASKPFSTMRKLQGNYAVNRADHNQVCEIWKIMTSKPYKVKPTIDDYSCYIKALIKGQKLVTAIAIIRQEVVPWYRELEEEHHQNVFEEMLQGQTSPSQRRLQIETKKEYAWYHINTWFREILEAASDKKAYRNGLFMQVKIPALIEEFSDFFHDTISYRTALGYVGIRRPNVVKRADWYQETRKMLPQVLGGMIVRKIDETNENFSPGDPETDWPEAAQFNLVRWQRRYRPRVRAEGLPPEAGDVNAREWWKTLEEELIR